MYSHCVAATDGPLTNCFEFINGTKIFMRREGGPNENQRSCYSGHKGRNCFVYLTVKTQHGLILYLHGQVAYRRHYMTLYRQGRRDTDIQQQSVINGVWFYLYVDSAFILRPIYTWLQQKHSDCRITIFQHCDDLCARNCWMDLQRF